MNKKYNRDWYGWIPTNLGELSFQLSASNPILEETSSTYEKIDNDRITINGLPINYISDTFCDKSKSLPFIQQEINNELYAKADITIKNNLSSKTFDASITIHYANFINISAKSEIKSNGEVKIFDILLNSFDDMEVELYSDIEEDFASIFYIVLKSIIHGDNHHHQKIDTALILTPDIFDKIKIHNQMNRYIKTVEHDIKNIDKCFGYLKIANSIKEMNGYYSYIEKFRDIFNIKVSDKDILDAKNVISSLSATVEKQLLKFNHHKETITIILTFIMLTISMNIFFNGFFDIDKSHSWGMRFNILFISISIIFFFYYKSFKCMIFTYIFYNYYDSYEYIYHLKNLKNRNMKQKVINNLINDTGFYVSFIVGICYIIVHLFVK